MRLSIFEGPIEKQLVDVAELKQPIDAEVLKDAADKITESRHPQSRVGRGIAATLDTVAAQGGAFTLEKLERTIGLLGVPSQVHAFWPAATRHQASWVDVQRGAAFIVQALVEWANAGRPEIATAKKQPLDTRALRAQMEASGVAPDKLAYVDRFLSAWRAKHGDTPASRKSLEAYSEALTKLQDDLDAADTARRHAGQRSDPHAQNASREVSAQKLGYFAINEFLLASAAKGELGKLAASIKPGAAGLLGA